MACIRDLCSTSLGTTARWQLICPAPGLEQAARFKLLSASTGAKIQLGMNPRPPALTVTLLALTSTLLAASDKPNTLTAQEQAAGWQLLFDGQSLAGWRPLARPGLRRTMAPGSPAARCARRGLCRDRSCPDLLLAHSSDRRNRRRWSRSRPGPPGCDGLS